MDYLPTLGEQWPHPRGIVSKYSLHGSFGIVGGLFSTHLRKKHANVKMDHFPKNFRVKIIQNG